MQTHGNRSREVGVKRGGCPVLLDVMNTTMMVLPIQESLGKPLTLPALFSETVHKVRVAVDEGLMYRPPP